MDLIRSSDHHMWLHELFCPSGAAVAGWLKIARWLCGLPRFWSSLEATTSSRTVVIICWTFTRVMWVFGGITGNLPVTLLGLCWPGHMLLLWQGGAWSRDNPRICVWLWHFAPCTSSWLFGAHYGGEVTSARAVTAACRRLFDPTGTDGASSVHLVVTWTKLISSTSVRCFLYSINAAVLLANLSN